MKKQILFSLIIFFALSCFGQIELVMENPGGYGFQLRDSMDRNYSEWNPGPYDSIQEIIVPPIPLNIDLFRTSTGYPELAKQADIKGKVVVRFHIDTTGLVREYIILKDPHPILTNAVITHLYILRFSPALVNGRPIPFWFTFPVDFQLIDGKKEKKKKHD